MLQKGFNQVAKLGCRWRYRRLLSVYLDDELNAPGAEVIASHLRECAGCRVEFEQLSFAKRALGAFEPPPMYAPLMTGNVSRLPVLKERSRLQRFYAGKIAVPLPLAAGFVIAFLGTLLGTWFAVATERTSIQTPVTVPTQPSVVVKTVEVPVDRVVTRIVYLRQPNLKPVRSIPSKNEFTFTAPDSKRNVARNNSTATEWSDSTLKDFRPATRANLRVVKEHER